MTTDTTLLLCPLAGPVLALASEFDAPGAKVRRGADGLPTAFRVFAYGPNYLTQEGQTAAVVIEPRHVEAIVHNAGGKPVPLDCNHAIHRLAAAAGKEENDPAWLPVLGERGTTGEALMVAEADGLWAHVQRWVPRAQLLLREKVARYFSPVVRGGDGQSPLRISSIALTPYPALDGLDPLVLSAESGISPARITPPPGGPAVDPTKLQELVNRICARLGITLPAEGAPPDLADLIDAKLNELLDAGDDAAAPTALALCAALDFDVAAKPRQLPRQAALGKLAALKLGAGQVVALSAENAALKQQLGAGQRERIIAAGVAAGKLTPELVAKLVPTLPDNVALSACIEQLPVAVPPGTTLDVSKRRPEPGAVVSDTQRKVYTALGITDPKAQEAAAKL